jgi:hypothetical protein
MLPDYLRVEQVFRGRNLQQARQEQTAALVPFAGKRVFEFLYQALTWKPWMAFPSPFYVSFEQFPV